MGLEQLSAAVGDQARLRALAAYGVLDSSAEQSFDDLAHFAAEMCSAPVALVSFVSSDRQWFKARVGFEPCETDLGRSVCRFVLDEPDLLVIPDLQADPRTTVNPLVTGEPHIRFYAGAPLRTREGHVLGSLCVIDTEPRPEGLTPRQADNLRRLAGQVMDQLELRRLVGQREQALIRSEAATGALALSEAHWRGLFENLQEGLILGRPVRDAEGRITDWRYLEVNAAWSEQVGVERGEAVGRTIREVLPGVQQEWVELATVVDTRETITFTRQVGQLDRWYDGRASALGPDLFSVLLLEVTERVRSAEALAASAARKSALAELGDHLRSAQGADAMSYVAAEIMGRTLGASRAGYGAVDATTEVVEVAPDWRAQGVASIAGRHSFRDYGSFIDELKQGRTVVVSDTAADPRTAASADAWERIGVRALVNAPILEAGTLASISLVHFDRPREISSEELAFIRAAADRTQIGVARLRGEERQAVLNVEISHRLKNILTMVLAVTTQTLRGRAEPGVSQLLAERLTALGRAQDVLMQAEWQAADLEALAREALLLAGVEARCAPSGPAVRLGSRAALSTSLLLHELATNAQKYGALSLPDGRVALQWRLEGEAEAVELVLDWREEGGPPARPPTRKGFGSRLLQLGLGGTGGSALTFNEEGFSATFRAPLRQVREA